MVVVKKILAICGSLRADSSNERLLRAAAKLGLPDYEITLFDGLRGLPFFNPDSEKEGLPKPVQDFRARITAADGLLISSPEYAHGVPGVLKNALDWLVADMAFPDKPVLLICGGDFAPAQLEETLKTMSAKFLRNVNIYGPTLRKAFDVRGELIDEGLMQAIRDSLKLF